jgi:hypothetical protein
MLARSSFRQLTKHRNKVLALVVRRYSLADTVILVPV